MDLSKLPKLSQTPPSANNAQAPADATGAAPAKVELFCRCGAPITPGTNFCSHCGANYYEAVGGRGGRARDDYEGPGPLWIEAFLAIAVGLFFLLMIPGTMKYYGHRWFGINTGPFVDPFTNQPVDYATYTDGSRKPYVDLINYWSDLAVSSFALVLILEGVVLVLFRNRWIILITAVLTVAVTLGNLIYVCATFSGGVGAFAFSMVAVIIGVLMAAYQFHYYKELSR
jgi:uncharacterized protein YjeT (DUF2065 family)